MARLNPNEHADPAYKYIDGKIKLLKKELDRLENSLLETQQIVTRFMILHDTAYCTDIVRRQKPEIVNDFYNQLLVDTARTRLAVTTSQDPFSIYTEFKNIILERFKDENIKIVDVG